MCNDRHWDEKSYSVGMEMHGICDRRVGPGSVRFGPVRFDPVQNITEHWPALHPMHEMITRPHCLTPLTSYHTLNLSYKESLPIPIWQPTYFGINPRRHNALSFHASPYSHIYIWALVRRWMITSNTKYINERVTYLLKNGVLVGIKPI